MTPEREAFEAWFAKENWVDWSDPNVCAEGLADPAWDIQLRHDWRTWHAALRWKAEQAQPEPVHVHDWVIWPETDGLEQRCMGCGVYRSTPEDEKFWLRAPTKQAQPEPVAEVFDTFGNTQDATKCVGHVWLAPGYFPQRGTKFYAHPPKEPT